MMVLTAARPKGRQAAVLLTYEKTDISEEIAPNLESFKYTDVAESKSDSVSITVNAKAAKWKNDWMPEKGVKLYPAIVVKDWNIGGIESGYRDYSAECGAFVLDDLSFAGAPDSLTMGGVAKPNDTSFSERNRTFTWKNTSVKKIAETIAGRYKLEPTTALMQRNRTEQIVPFCKICAAPMHWLSKSTLQSSGCTTGKSTRRKILYGRYMRAGPLEIRRPCA